MRPGSWYVWGMSEEQQTNMFKKVMWGMESMDNWLESMLKKLWLETIRFAVSSESGGSSHTHLASDPQPAQSITTR
jgi:hypothetical protein